MLETALASAIKAVVSEWAQATSPENQVVELQNPATLAVTLGLAVEAVLIDTGFSLDSIRAELLAAPFIHLKGVFDILVLPDTPTTFNPVPDVPETLVARASILAVHALLLKETVSYGTENSGNLFVNLVALEGEGAFPEKSKQSMRGHTDAVSFPFNGEDDEEDDRIAPSPDLVTLAGLRNPDKVPTNLMPLSDILAHMHPGDVAELKKPQFSFHPQKTFIPAMKALLGKLRIVHDAPVLKDVEDSTFIRYSHSSVVPPDEAGLAATASNSLEAACNETAVAIVVEPGDVLIISNRLSLHGRGKPTDQVGGESRWLLRTYGLETSNLPPHKRHLDGRPAHVLYP
ncbi:TauD/TfdA family dioxygenase [Comamonas thiooxydans]|uniref:TauD/TfdA family dioxygenase n=1 Tax=Comamonas thiooxydans TaxID=363952 RepID=UPI00050E73BF|nr:TauD/TfdA family dioxygenase [Comamonas thiooxydans]KGG96023.1 taurine catabolism dioxygenase [Comamonas thiooxydans]KGH02407.1 taurine catabolism dioxygenase [Comamonas thiooxydans]KGH09676.1 taurine catabolism dioxygenase [Comamonas thiooxydans]KGH16127.1 taurine catabolism dioxygenase [Comamonas thiooxydans]TZG10197.1 taurine catabolism dioxygenase TauD [Comamonas thiooxydans]